VIVIDTIRAQFDAHGAKPYSGEPITQLEHALQSAALAEAEGASEEMFVAAFLHDLGHMMGDLEKADPKRLDDLHQFRALPLLRHHFSDAVIEPIRMHVDAKRYLCATDPEYAAGLSPVSVNSLRLQGGPYTEAEARKFESHPYSNEAVRLRRWDDRAKVPGCVTPDIEHFMQKVKKAMLPGYFVW